MLNVMIRIVLFYTLPTMIQVSGESDHCSSKTLAYQKATNNKS